MKNELIISPSSKSSIAGSLELLFREYDEKKCRIKLVADFASDKDDVLNYFCIGNKTSSFMTKEILQEEGAIKSLDAEFWSRAMNMTDVLSCMPAKDRNNWSEMIHDLKTPPFERESVILSLQDLLMSRETFLAKKVDGIFQTLSGKHVTNSPMAFRERMIIDSVLDRYGWLNYRTKEYIHDLRVIIAKLHKEDGPSCQVTSSDLSDIVKSKSFGQWFDFDGGRFRIKIFKKGTAHMEISEDVSIKLNEILATLHPSVIAAKTGSIKRQTRAQERSYIGVSWEARNELEGLIDSLSRKNTLYKASLHAETEEILKMLGGTCHKNLWTFSFNVAPAISMIVRTGVLPNKESHQFYPTKSELAKRIVDMAKIKDDETVLEPSAGHGGIANYLPLDRTTCVEISELNCEILKANGCQSVMNGDFLELSASLVPVDVVVMNPPFSGGDAKTHVQFAWDCVKEGGRLLAILPASLKGKEIIPGYHHEESEIIEDAFDGTNVRVYILQIEK